MAAGGFKVFTTGEVLTSADTNNFLMQGVLVFDDATARDAAITAPVEGQFAYLKDTNVTTYYTGSAWANLDTTGMTNPMTTTADIIYSSSGSTPARLGIGTAGQVLQVNSGATAPEWAAPAGGGGKVLQVVQSIYSTQTSITSTTLATTGLSATITPSAATSEVLVLVTQGYYYNTGSNSLGFGMSLYRGGSSISVIGTRLANGGPNGTNNTIAFNYLDSPSSTSALTYETYGNIFQTTSTIVFQGDTTYSSITLLEIGA
jgi:hypothetical protein